MNEENLFKPVIDLAVYLPEQGEYKYKRGCVFLNRYLFRTNLNSQLNPLNLRSIILDFGSGAEMSLLIHPIVSYEF
jgi:hypothetical protein